MSKETDDPRREFLVTTLSLGLFAGANLASLFQTGHARGDIPDKLPPGRSIYKLQGNVTVDGKPADINTPIGPGSIVKTGHKSRVIFVVAEDAFILRSNSQIEMKSTDGVIVEGMRILSGKILSVFGRREKPHTITTSTATIGIRGTGIYLESEADRSYVCTCYGQTRIVASADPDTSRDVISKHHDSPLYVLPSASNGKLIVPAPFINHNDAELALIEELVGRTTPFAYSGGGYEVPRKRSY
ncbi:MAG: FecR domain-containing protein [Gammaproteobacteria bacterium]|nr:FecR domain-containing protein [Gammaproteobacteria bacterium]